MAKEATLQVRMDADLKEKAETLYKEMGTSFAEAVRILRYLLGDHPQMSEEARQIIEKGPLLCRKSLRK